MKTDTQSAATPALAVAPGSAPLIRFFRLGKPYRTADMPPGRYAYAVKMRVHPEAGLQVRLEFETASGSFVHKRWHNAADLL